MTRLFFTSIPVQFGSDVSLSAFIVCGVDRASFVLSPFAMLHDIRPLSSYTSDHRMEPGPGLPSHVTWFCLSQNRKRRYILTTPINFHGLLVKCYLWKVFFFSKLFSVVCMYTQTGWLFIHWRYCVWKLEKKYFWEF